MDKMMILKINNSEEAAIKTGKWKNPGAKLYNQLLDACYIPNDDVDDPDATYTHHYLKETYAICPDGIRYGPYGRTPYSRSGCKYPHHQIVKTEDGHELVVSIPGLKAAYSRAKSQNAFRGELKEHLERHYKEMGLYEDSTMAVEEKIENNFDDILSYIGESYNQVNQLMLQDEESDEMLTLVMNESVSYDIDDSSMYEYIDSEFEWMDRVLTESEIDDNIMNINTPEELLEWMKNNISYGWISSEDGNVYGTSDEDDENYFYKYYRLQSPTELIKNRVGVCWDQAELEREWFTNHGIEHGVFYIEIQDGMNMPTHTFLVYKQNDSYYWFENSWYDMRGIRTYNDLSSLLSDVVTSHQKANNDTTSPVVVTWLKDTPNYGCTCEEFMNYANNQRRLDMDNLPKLFDELMCGSLNNITESFEYDDMDDVLFIEGSHGKLKYDFRMGWDYNTGHQIKIVYSLDNIDVTDVGDFYYNYDGKKHGATHDSHLDYVRKNIKRKGNTDHQSRGQKVLVIEDLATGERLKSVKLLNPYCRHIETRRMVQTKDNLAKARDYANNKNPSCISILRVGMIDNTPSFKSTHWASKVTDKETGEDLRFNKLFKSEIFKHGRGHKIDNINAKDFSVFDDDGKYMTFHNPNKKQALKELYLRERDILNRLNALKNQRDMNDPDTRKKYDAGLDNLRIVQNDIKTIETGKYDLSIMRKYRDYDEAVDAGLSGRQTLEFNTYMDYRPPTEIIRSEENMTLFEKIVESLDDITVFEEKSHGKLKYCYRVGFDASTGKQVAVEFILDPDKITAVSDSVLINSVTKAHRRNIDINGMQSKAVPQLKSMIRKYGHIDFSTDALKVNAIFERNGKSLKHVKLFGLFSEPVLNAIKIFDKVYLNIQYGKVTSEELFSMKEFQKHMAVQLKSPALTPEEYTVGTTAGAGKYKTTKLLWDSDLFKTYKFTPMIRGYNKPGRGMNPKDADNWLKNNMINKFKESTSVEEDLELVESLVKTHLSWGEQLFILGSLPGSPVVAGDEEYSLDPPLEKIYFENMMKENDTIIGEHRNAPYTMETLPDIMYYSSRHKHDVLDRKKLFLSPYIEISSIFMVDKVEIIADYIRNKYGREPERITFNTMYDEWNMDNDDIDLNKPLEMVHITHNIPSITEVITGTSSGFIHVVDVSNVKDNLSLFSTNDPDREVIYQGPPLVPIDIIPHTIKWEMRYDEYNVEQHGEGIAENVVFSIRPGRVFLEAEESTDNSPPELTLEDDDSDEEQPKEEEPAEEEKPKEEPVQEIKPQSLPKQTDDKEKDKNGVRRKKLYIAFIEWAKKFNPKNTFGSTFDKDVFNVTYPFIPEEMRYFYRLANPILCVLQGQLTFFAFAELGKLNSKNTKLGEMMIFAATPNDMRIFSKVDKKIYLGVEDNGQIKLTKELGPDFDNYLQNMIKQGDILHSPLEENTPEE